VSEASETDLVLPKRNSGSETREAELGMNLMGYYFMDTGNQFSEKNETNSGYDVIIVGSGPAGMFAAHELSAVQALKILVVDMGRDIEKRLCYMKTNTYCMHCTPCEHYVRRRRLRNFF